MPRFAIIEHTGAPDDPSGRHFDLLVEAGEACRTWRLAALPVPEGPPVAVVELPPHRLAWLDHEAGEVSGGRGFARNVARGNCRWLTDHESAQTDSKGVFIPAAIAGHFFCVLPTEEGWIAVAAE